MNVLNNRFCNPVWAVLMCAAGLMLLVLVLPFTILHEIWNEVKK